MEKSSFFNSVNGDRRYKAEDWASYFSAFIGNGVFPLPSTNLQVVAGDGMSIVLRSGKAFINGYYYENTADLIIPLAVADGVLKRIDRIVIRWDLLERKISARVKSSSFSSSPTALTLQRDADAFELCVADVLINNGATSISQAQITDQRLDFSLCGTVGDAAARDAVEQMQKLVEQVQKSSVPQGCILMWSGSVATIPSGWALCTGQTVHQILQTALLSAQAAPIRPAIQAGRTALRLVSRKCRAMHIILQHISVRDGRPVTLLSIPLGLIQCIPRLCIKAL